MKEKEREKERENMAQFQERDQSLGASISSIGYNSETSPGPGLYQHQSTSVPQLRRAKSETTVLSDARGEITFGVPFSAAPTSSII